MILNHRQWYERANGECGHRGARFLGCFLILALVGCGNDGSDDGDENPDSEKEDDTEASSDQDAGTVSVCGPPDTDLAEGDAAELFDQPAVPAFDFYLPPEEWEQLQENARDEEYVEAEACFEGRAIGKVGIRFKGSYGTLLNCFDENGINTECRKLSIKAKFDEYDVDRRFFGLKRLNFQGYRYDDSYMKEKLAYEMYRSMDIVAPRASWAEVRVNDELQGLFGMVEQIDGRFTADRWSDNGDGNLYKELWPINTAPDYVVSRLKTNEEDPKVDAFIAFSEAMLGADEADLRSTLGDFMNLDYIDRYMAVDDAIANFDGITAYYTSEDELWAGNHNFYIYEEADDLFTLIPWDMESTFALGTFGNVPRWTEVPEDCSLTYAAWGNPATPVIAPGCDRVFRAIAQDLKGYQEAGQALLDGAFAEDAMAEAIDDYAAFIRNAVEADPNGPGVTEFEKNIAFIKDNIPRLRARLEFLLTGEPWTPFEIAVDKINDFEAQDEFGLLMTAEVYAGEGTTIEYSINTENPLFGERDLLLTFEFAEQGETWVSYEVPLVGGINDLTGFSGIRLWMRADKERAFRIEFDSSYSTADNGWIRPGWDFNISEEPTEITLPFADAAAPSWATKPLTASVEEILTKVHGLIFSPQNGANGDQGFVDIDNIEFF